MVATPPPPTGMDENQFRAVINAFGDQAVFSIDAGGRLVGWSHAALHLLGYTEKDVLGRSAALLLSPKADADEALDDLLERARRDGKSVEDTWCWRKGGSRFWARSVITPVLLTSSAAAAGDPSQGFTWVVRDLGEIRRLQDRLREAANTDFLTGALNRRHFYSMADHEITRRRRYEHPVSLFKLDVDRFGALNDQHGQMIGDTLLRRLARVCQANLRDVDLFVRLGGDEFAALLPDTDAVGAAAVAERIRKGAAAIDITAGGVPVAFTISIGVSEMSVQNDDLEELLRAADHALRQAKGAGSNRVAVSTSQATAVPLEPEPASRA